jgi:hypothetical protein
VHAAAAEQKSEKILKFTNFKGLDATKLFEDVWSFCCSADELQKHLFEFYLRLFFLHIFVLILLHVVKDL